MVLREIGKREWRDAPLPRRFAHELGGYLLSVMGEKGEGVRPDLPPNPDEQSRIRHARAVLVYFYRISNANGIVDPRVLAYLEWARSSYNQDPNRNIAKALGLVQSTRGNPGHGRDGRTDGERAQDAQDVIELQRAGKTEEAAVNEIARRAGVSPRTIRGDVDQERASQKSGERRKTPVAQRERERRKKTFPAGFVDDDPKERE